MSRTIKLCGIGFHETGSEIIVKLDGNIIFQGAVTTDIHNPVNAAGSPEFDAEIVNWEESLNATTHALEIQATQGHFLYTRALSNYMSLAKASTPESVFSSGSLGFISCYAQAVDTGVYRDPNTEVFIDGVERVRYTTDVNKSLGQFYRLVREGQVLTCVLNISAGLDSPIITDGSEILGSVSYIANGTDVEFLTPSYEGSATNKNLFYVDGTLINGDDVESSDSTTLRFNSPPVAGTAIKIDKIETWDYSLSSYANFEGATGT